MDGDDGLGMEEDTRGTSRSSTRTPSGRRRRDSSVRINGFDENRRLAPARGGYVRGSPQKEEQMAAPQEGEGVMAKDENDRKNLVSFHPYFYIYSARFRIYRKKYKNRTEVGRGISYLYLGIPFLVGMIPYLSRIYKIRRINNRHTI